MPAFDFPKAYRNLGDELGRDTASEARLRTAVSRYYYSAFHLARNRAPAHGVTLAPIGGGADHQACWAEYQRKPEKAQIGNDGNRLKALRHAADYNATNVEPNGKPTNWVDKVTEAEELVRKLFARL